MIRDQALVWLQEFHVLDRTVRYNTTRSNPLWGTFLILYSRENADIGVFRLGIMLSEDGSVLRNYRFLPLDSWLNLSIDLQHRVSCILEIGRAHV